MPDPIPALLAAYEDDNERAYNLPIILAEIGGRIGGDDAHHVSQGASEIVRLRMVESAARDLVDLIRRTGTHENWKRLAAALETK